MKHGLFALSVVLMSSMPAAAETTRETVAVMDFQAINAPASEASVLSEFVRSAVIQSGVYTVVDKKNMDKLLSEQAFQQTGCTSDECAVKLGRVLNVRKMIVGSYSQMGDTRFLTSRLVDVETGKIEASAKEKGFTPGDADTAAERMVSSLIGGEAPEEVVPAPRVVRRANTEQAVAVAGKKSGGGGDGYIMFFYGRDKAVMKNIKLESLKNYGGVPTWKETISAEVVMLQDRAPMGLRAGMWWDIFGIDGELSYERLRSKAADVEVEGVSYDGSSYSSYSYGTSVGDGWIIETPINMGMNLYLHATSKWAFQPYVGMGFGVVFNIVNSDTIQPPNLEKFFEPGIGFYAKFPMGARLNVTRHFFLYGEYQPYYKWATFSTVEFTNNWRQSYQVSSKTATAGMGFYF